MNTELKELIERKIKRLQDSVKRDFEKLSNEDNFIRNFEWGLSEDVYKNKFEINTLIKISEMESVKEIKDYKEVISIMLMAEGLEESTSHSSNRASAIRNKALRDMHSVFYLSC